MTQDPTAHIIVSETSRKFTTRRESLCLDNVCHCLLPNDLCDTKSESVKMPQSPEWLCSHWAQRYGTMPPLILLRWESEGLIGIWQLFSINARFSHRVFTVPLGPTVSTLGSYPMSWPKALFSKAIWAVTIPGVQMGLAPCHQYRRQVPRCCQAGLRSWVPFRKWLTRVDPTVSLSTLLFIVDISAIYTSSKQDVWNNCRLCAWHHFTKSFHLLAYSIQPIGGRCMCALNGLCNCRFACF